MAKCVVPKASIPQVAAVDTLAQLYILHAKRRADLSQDMLNVSNISNYLSILPI